MAATHHIPTTPVRTALLLGVVIAICLLLAGCAAGQGADQARSRQSDLPEATEPAGPATVTFIAVGDIVAHDEMIAHWRNGDTGGYDFSGIFAPMAERISSYDLASVTQETPLVYDEDRVGGYPIFGTPAAMGDAIVGAGFDIVTSATNHSMDQGADGILTTVEYWKKNHPEITLLGIHDSPDQANGVTFVERNGIRIAMTDCTYSLNGFVLPEGSEYEVDLLDDLDAILENVRAAESEADITICYVHMGDEYSTVPSQEQRDVAAALIDAGAEVVIGSHVHVIQPMEVVTTDEGNRGIVYFSIGNYASNQADVENMLGGAAIFTIEKTPAGNGSKAKTRVSSYSFVPTFCHYDYDTTQMYFLNDYTNEQAAGHFITLYGHPFTVEQVRDIWTGINNGNYSYSP